MKEKLPCALYRGDSDPNGTRKLKASWRTGFLLTNLSDSGSGREIFSAPLVDFICNHVDLGWAKSHFLSFSECPDIAFKFATGQSDQKLVIASEGNWDAVIIHLCKDRFTSVVQVGVGVYRCEFQGGLPNGATGTNFPRLVSHAYKGGKTVTVLLIDVVSCLGASQLNESVCNSLKNATRDREWLVLPIDSVPEVDGEFTALLDDGCLSEVVFYKRCISQ